MARTSVPVTTLTSETAVADPAGTALDATDHHVIDCAGIPIEELAIRVVNTTASEKTVTVVAGDSPPADQAGLGPLSIVCDAATVDTYYLTQAVDAESIEITTPVVEWASGLISARHLQSDGTVNVDVESGMTGTISAFRIPRH